MVALPGPLLPVAAGGGELGQVGQGEVAAARRPVWISSRAGTWDPVREPDPFGEPQVGRGGDEPVQVGRPAVSP